MQETQINIRLSAEDKERLKSLAKDRGLSVADYIRLRAFSEGARFEDTMTIKDAARYLQVSNSTLVKMCRNNDIKAALIEGKYVFRKSDVEEYLEDRTQRMDINRKARQAGISELLTVAETAQICKVKNETVRNWAREKKLPSVRVGGQMRFKSEDVNNFIESTTIKTKRKH